MTFRCLCVLLYHFTFLSFCLETRHSLNGVDTVILNETSPVIMTKPPDDNDISPKSVHTKTPNASGTQKRKDPKTPKDDKSKNIPQDGIDAIALALNSQIDAQKPVSDKPLSKADSDTVHINKVQPVDTENWTDVVTNNEPTVKSSKEHEETGDTDMKIKPDENHEDEDSNTYYNTISKRVQVPELADYVNSKSYESTVNEFEVSVFLNKWTMRHFEHLLHINIEHN